MTLHAQMVAGQKRAAVCGGRNDKRLWFQISKYVAFILLLVGGVGHSFAQTGSIIGTVLDPSGASVPGATVTVTSQATGISSTAVTNATGAYSFAALTPAPYSMVVTAAGFQSTEFKDVVLTVAQILSLNVNLKVGGINTTVSVATDVAAPVETASFALSTVVDSQQINDLPLILRDPYQLVLLSPGVVTTTNIGGFSVNGQRDRNNNFMLDGADNNDTSVPGGQGGISSANPDSAQEFRVITNNFDAEFGRNTGAIVDVITRGGTNKFHGDAYEFGRYNALGARDWFNRRTDGPQDPYVRNDFGASLGGPIWTDHSFFFLNGEAQRFRTTRTSSQTVPTAAFRTGAFTFIDPFDGSSTPVDLTNPANPNNLSGLTLDPVVAKILALTPLPTVDAGDGVSGTYIFPSSDALNGYQFVGRFDHLLTHHHEVTVRYQYDHSNESDPFHDEVLPGYGTTSNVGTDHNGVISLTSNLGSNVNNVLRGSYNLRNTGFLCAHSKIDAVTGVDAFGNGRDVSIPYFFTLGCVDLGDSNGQARLTSTLMFADTFSITRGAHNMKFGAEYRSIKDTSFDNFSQRDLVSLNVASTDGVDAYQFAGDPNSPTYTTFQDLVFGAQGAIANESENQFFTHTGTRRGTDLTRFQQHELGAFAQDTWKISPNFTVIAGLRYEFNGVPYEKDGNFSNFIGDASAILPAGGSFSFTNVGPGTGHQLYSDSFDLIEPRIGFSYDPKGDGKTAIRGGYGIFHDRLFDNLFGNARSNPPFQATLSSFPSPGPSPTLSTQPFPGALTPTKIVNPGDLFEPVIIDPHMKIPGNQTWNLGVERQLAQHLTVEMNYVGSHGTHILREINSNPPQPGLVSQLLANGVPEGQLQRFNLYGGVADPTTGNTEIAVNNNAFYIPLEQTSTGGSNYNAFQAKVNERVGGLYLTGSYSYAHSLDDSNDSLAPGSGNSGLPRNAFNVRQEYGNSPFDVRHRGTIAGTYDLPIGRGERFASSGIMGFLLQGMQISGIQQAQTGQPFDIRGTRDNQHQGLNNRPELVGNPYPSNRVPSALGKVTGPAASAFANAPYDTVPNVGRNKFYGPHFVNLDAVFQKTQSIAEGVKLQFRAESYNVLNHPNFGQPTGVSNSIASPYFGVSTAEVGQNDGTTGARQIQGALKIIF